MINRLVLDETVHLFRSQGLAEARDMLRRTLACRVCVCTCSFSSCERIWVRTASGTGTVDMMGGWKVWHAQAARRPRGQGGKKRRGADWAWSCFHTLRRAVPSQRHEIVSNWACVTAAVSSGIRPIIVDSDTLSGTGTIINQGHKGRRCIVLLQADWDVVRSGDCNAVRAHDLHLHRF